jgi:hypothetical protein
MMQKRAGVDVRRERAPLALSSWEPAAVRCSLVALGALWVRTTSERVAGMAIRCQYCRVEWTTDADGMNRFTCPDCGGAAVTHYEADMGFEQSNWHNTISLADVSSAMVRGSWSAPTFQCLDRSARTVGCVQSRKSYRRSDSVTCSPVTRHLPTLQAGCGFDAERGQERRPQSEIWWLLRLSPKIPRSRTLAPKVRQACWRLSPLFHKGAQNFRVINFDHVGSLTAGCGPRRRDTRDDTSACARRIGEGPVCHPALSSSVVTQIACHLTWDGTESGR